MVDIRIKGSIQSLEESLYVEGIQSVWIGPYPACTVFEVP